MRKLQSLVLAFLASISFGAIAQQTPVLFYGIMELSGTGATPGTNFDNGVKLAVKEINAAGGILGRKINYVSSDTQTNPTVAKAVAQKAIDDGAYVVLGPVHSGSMIVSMGETRQRGSHQFHGWRSRGHYAAGQSLRVPHVVHAGDIDAETGALHQRSNESEVNRHRFHQQRFRQGWARRDGQGFGGAGYQGRRRYLDRSRSGRFLWARLEDQAKRRGCAVCLPDGGEGARLLRELKKQGFDKPIIGETTIIGQKVIELAGPAADGILGHVGLTPDAPQATVKAFDEKYSKEYKQRTDHNGMKGYSAVYIVKAMTEKLGKFDSKALAAALHGAKISAKDNPGVLLDVSFDQKGDLDRESFIVKVVGGKQQVIATVPPVGAK